MRLLEASDIPALESWIAWCTLAEKENLGRMASTATGLVEGPHRTIMSQFRRHIESKQMFWTEGGGWVSGTPHLGIHYKLETRYTFSSGSACSWCCVRRQIPHRI